MRPPPLSVQSLVRKTKGESRVFVCSQKFDSRFDPVKNTLALMNKSLGNGLLWQDQLIGLSFTIVNPFLVFRNDGLECFFDLLRSPRLGKKSRVQSWSAVSSIGPI